MSSLNGIKATWPRAISSVILLDQWNRAASSGHGGGIGVANVKAVAAVQPRYCWKPAFSFNSCWKNWESCHPSPPQTVAPRWIYLTVSAEDAEHQTGGATERGGVVFNSRRHHNQPQARENSLSAEESFIWKDLDSRVRHADRSVA